MKTIFINGNEYTAEDGTKLKDVLVGYGMAFPCGGNGQCGKCRIKCKEIPITDKDTRFLTQNALEEGWRIACDKTVGDYSVECPPPARPEKVRELSSCNIIATVDVRTITVGIADDEIAEKVTVQNPLYDGNGITGIAEEYEKDGKRLTHILRAVLAKESIELFEKYNKAQAETFVVAANGLFMRILTGMSLEGEEPDYNAIKDEHMFDLPTETTYFLPTVNAYIGGDLLSETVNCETNTLVLDCGDVFGAVYLGKENSLATAMWDMTYDEIGIKAINAAIKVLVGENKPFVKIYGSHARKLEKTLLSDGFDYSIKKKELENVGKALSSLRFRAKLNKEKNGISVVNILANEEFHKYFAE